ncbi:Transcription factor IIIB 90 kDa subunit [Dictyocoela muelleri]|nr:Transcription factor IIIB 90 kDa subunit [Dictyocoela muelleri]
MICKHCSSQMSYEPSLDLTICTICNYVTDSQIENKVEFTSEKSASGISGRLIRISDNHVRIGNSLRQVSNNHIETLIGNICGPLGLQESHGAHAFRWYKLTLQHNLSKGRNIMCTLSACVYIVCRLESTPHFLIDFSVLLHIDVFKIGKIFMKLVTLLNINLPLVDPAIYVYRYFTKLNFRNKKIMDMSMRIIQRMKRDWIVVGKRPNNVCGAALLVAGRVYGEERSIKEVASVVNVCEMSIKKRMSEMNMTKSANLDVKEFNEVWLDEENEFNSERKNVNKDKDIIVVNKEFNKNIIEFNKDKKDVNEFDNNIIFDNNFNNEFDKDEIEMNKININDNINFNININNIDKDGIEMNKINNNNNNNDNIKNNFDKNENIKIIIKDTDDYSEKEISSTEIKEMILSLKRNSEREKKFGMKCMESLCKKKNKRLNF